MAFFIICVITMILTNILMFWGGMVFKEIMMGKKSARLIRPAKITVNLTKPVETLNYTPHHDMRDKDYEYQAYVCNNALYGTLVRFKASGIPDEDLRTMLKCTGDVMARLSFLDYPIDYYIRHAEEWFLKGGKT